MTDVCSVCTPLPLQASRRGQGWVKMRSRDTPHLHGLQGSDTTLPLPLHAPQVLKHKSWVAIRAHMWRQAHLIV